MKTTIAIALAGTATLAGCGDTRDGGSPFDTAGVTATGGPGGDGGPGQDDGGSTGDGGSATGVVDGTAGDDDGPGIKLDVEAPGSDDTCAGEGCNAEGCTFVDLLFVIDNSGSMGDYQAALGLAFPQFAETLAATLPPGTNVHVGVTSTEMGYSSMGSTSITNGSCSFIGDDGQTNDAFYITPDVMATDRNGAQGRLYDPGGGEYFYEFDTDDAAAIAGLATWFSSAVNIGEGGSNIEMSAAPAGWVADAANAATNAGFIRDEGAVMVVFFLQDEPDQTPAQVGGMPTGPQMLDKLAAAKAGCGGTDCIVAGGFLAANACNADGNLPLDDFLAGVGESPVVAPLPDENTAEDNPQAAADEMNETLSETLAAVIAATCEQIPPAG
jgi:hypothetical protein